MGCISSKAIARTMSLREEIVNHNGNDNLFAYLRSANTNTTPYKLRTSKFDLPSSDPHETNKYPSAEINGKEDLQSSNYSFSRPDSGRFTRSKSCQINRETETDWLDEDKSMIGSRSFHTVEEYDALLERIHRLSSTSVELEISEDVKLQQSNDNHTDKCIPATATDSPEKEPGNLGNFEKVVRVDCTREMGWKRKAVAKDLKSLDVSNIEFPVVARFRQQISVEGQIYSPGTYITPKFGSYNARAKPGEQEEEGGGENSVFSPELVAAFEDCMHQLQVEEENILKDMDELSPIDDEMENQIEEIPSNKKVDI